MPFLYEPMADVIGQCCKVAAMRHASEPSLLKAHKDVTYGDGGGPGPEKRAEKVVAPVRPYVACTSHISLEASRCISLVVQMKGLRREEGLIALALQNRPDKLSRLKRTSDC